MNTKIWHLIFYVYDWCVFIIIIILLLILICMLIRMTLILLYKIIKYFRKKNDCDIFVILFLFIIRHVLYYNNKNLTMDIFVFSILENFLKYIAYACLHNIASYIIHGIIVWWVFYVFHINISDISHGNRFSYFMSYFVFYLPKFPFYVRLCFF